MRISSLLLALPALSLAEEQVPLADKLKGWFNKAQAYIPSSVPSIIPDPLDAGAAKVAKQFVHPLNLSNWKDVLSPSADAQRATPEEWMVFLTGGNKTCYGQCGDAVGAWNVRFIIPISVCGNSLLTVHAESCCTPRSYPNPS
jgi:hypothetical protein